MLRDFTPLWPLATRTGIKLSLRGTTVKLECLLAPPTLVPSANNACSLRITTGFRALLASLTKMDTTDANLVQKEWSVPIVEQTTKTQITKVQEALELLLLASTRPSELIFSWSLLLDGTLPNPTAT